MRLDPRREGMANGLDVEERLVREMRAGKTPESVPLGVSTSTGVPARSPGCSTHKPMRFLRNERCAVPFIAKVMRPSAAAVMVPSQAKSTSLFTFSAAR